MLKIQLHIDKEQIDLYDYRLENKKNFLGDIITVQEFYDIIPDTKQSQGHDCRMIYTPFIGHPTFKIY